MIYGGEKFSGLGWWWWWWGRKRGSKYLEKSRERHGIKIYTHDHALVISRGKKKKSQGFSLKAYGYKYTSLCAGAELLHFLDLSKQSFVLNIVGVYTHTRMIRCTRLYLKIRERVRVVLKETSCKPEITFQTIAVLWFPFPEFLLFFFFSLFYSSRIKILFWRDYVNHDAIISRSLVKR